MHLEMTGLAQMEGRARLVYEQVRGEALRRAVKEAGGVVLEEMQLRAPVLDAKTANSTALDPGELKASLGELVRMRGKDGYAEAIVGPRRNQHVARWVEYGHNLVRRSLTGKVKLRVRGGGRGDIVGQVKAHPFLRPAWEAAADAAWKRMQEVFSDAIRSVTK